MNEQKNYQELMLRHARLQTGLLAGMLVIFLVLACFLGIQVKQVTNQVQALDLDKINSTIASLEKVAGELSEVDMQTINDAIGSLKDAAAMLAQADMGAVNEGIRALSEAADSLKELDIQQLNGLIKGLESVTSQMQATTAAFSKLFGRG